jgi:hypothetical protein
MTIYGIRENAEAINLLNSYREVTSVEPYLFPIDVAVDQKMLQDSFYELFAKLGLDYDNFIKEESTESARLATLFSQSNMPFLDFIKTEEFKSKQVDPNIKAIAWDMNLNHLPGLTGSDRWNKYKGQFEHIFAQDISPADHTELLEEVKDLYLGKIIQDIFNFHKSTYNTEFKGRAAFMWINANEGYNFHVDGDRTPVRYHVPVITNSNVYWLFKKDSEIIKMHMPAGTAWQFFPTTIEHTVINQGNTPRVHLVITEVK